MKTTLLFCTLLIIGTSVKAQNRYFEIYTDSASLKNQNDKLISDIERIVKRIEPNFSFKGLTTEIPNTFMPGQYREKAHKIYLNTWQVGGPPMEGFLTNATGSKEEGERMAALFFYGFFLPHEVGHALQYQTKNVPKSAYDGEYKANELAVVYWRSQNKEKELQQCYELAIKVLPKLHNPVPENTDAHKYITENYWDLVNDPFKYGYIQLSQIVEIMDNKTLPDFETYIKKYFEN